MLQCSSSYSKFDPELNSTQQQSGNALPCPGHCRSTTELSLRHQTFPLSRAEKTIGIKVQTEVLKSGFFL